MRVTTAYKIREFSVFVGTKDQMNVVGMRGVMEEQIEEQRAKPVVLVYELTEEMQYVVFSDGEELAINFLVHVNIRTFRGLGDY